MKPLHLLCFVAALVFLGPKISDLWAAMNDLAKLGVALCVALVGAVLTAIFALPRMGEAIVRFLFAWNDPPELSKAQALPEVNALLARGDYTGAVAECERQLATEPANTFLIAELAKIYSDHLHDPERGVAVLAEGLASRTWPVDDDAYLRFRQVDAFLQMDNREAAERVLEHLIADYPGTKHSGSAYHKLHGLRPRATPAISKGWSAAD
jgi:hypothetical protein